LDVDDNLNFFVWFVDYYAGFFTVRESLVNWHAVVFVSWHHYFKQKFGGLWSLL